MLSFFSDASEETRVELQRRVELDGGILMDGAGPLNKKEPIRLSSSAHITVHMAQYCFSSSLHPLSLLRTFESELSWLPATKQSKTWGTCQKIKVWRLPCLATPGPPPLDIGEGKEVDMEDRCPRSKLLQQCIRYLGPVSASSLAPMNLKSQS